MYVALFKLTGTGPATVSATFAEIGLPAGVTSAAMVDLWSGTTLPAKAMGKVAATLSPCSQMSEGPCCALYKLVY